MRFGNPEELPAELKQHAVTIHKAMDQSKDLHANMAKMYIKD
jgi:hypothetical protein